jgi:hypothetical protein
MPPSDKGSKLEVGKSLSSIAKDDRQSTLKRHLLSRKQSLKILGLASGMTGFR